MILENKNKDLLKIVSYYVKRYPRRTVVVCSALILSSLFESIGIVTLLPLVDIVVGKGEATGEVSMYILALLDYLNIPIRLGPLLAFFLLCLILKEILKSLALILAGFSTSKVAMDLRLLLIKSLFNAKWSYYVSLRTGGFSNTMSTEALRASSLYMDTVKFFMLFLQIIIYVSLSILVSWVITVVALLSGVISYYALSRLVHMSRHAGNLQTNAFHLLSAKITDLLAAIKVFKAMGNNDVYYVLKNDITNLDESYKKQVISSSLMGLFQELMPIILIVIVVYIGLSVGKVELSAFVVSAVLFLSLLRRVNTFQKILANAANKESTFVSIQNTIKQAKLNKENNFGTKIASMDKEIKYDSVSIKHGGKYILESIDMNIPSKKLTAIIGASGVGKTSLVDMLVGLNDIEAGAIYFDDVPMSNINIENLRSRVGYVGQEAILFNDTILNNITMNDATISDRDILDALKKSHSYDFVMKLEHGLKSNVGERGAKLSGGQKQKLCIARAIVRKPDILIFDEVTSSLDPKSDEDISILAKELSENITVIAITHRDKMESFADHVYEIKNGNIFKKQSSST